MLKPAFNRSCRCSRSEDEIRVLLTGSGFPMSAITLEKEETGPVLLAIVSKPVSDKPESIMFPCLGYIRQAGYGPLQ